MFRNDKRKRERAARCHGLSGRSFGCTEIQRYRGACFWRNACAGGMARLAVIALPRKPSRPTRVTAYGNVRAMIKAS